MKKSVQAAFEGVCLFLCLAFRFEKDVVYLYFFKAFTISRIAAVVSKQFHLRFSLLVATIRLSKMITVQSEDISAMTAAHKSLAQHTDV